MCTLKSSRRSVPAGSAVPIFQQPVATLLAGCGRCSRLSCLLTFHLEDSDGQQGPTNHHFLSSPKDAQGLQRPNITVRHSDKQVFGWIGLTGAGMVETDNVNNASLFSCRRRCTRMRRDTKLPSTLLLWLFSSGSMWETSQVVSAPTAS